MTSISLKTISASELRVPTQDELKARRERLFGKKPVKEIRASSENDTNEAGTSVEILPETIFVGIAEVSANMPASVDPQNDIFVEEYLSYLDTKPEKSKADVVEFPNANWFRTENILKRVASEHGVSVSDLRGERRFRNIVRARQHAAYALATERPELSRCAIARIFNRDHSTIYHAMNSHADAHGLPRISYK